jgi:three-Cys-motif partner protein
MTDWGGYWTEVKLEVLRKYLVAFNTASTRAGATVYLDLFAGRLTNRRPDTGAKYRGSSALAMAVEPPFTQLVLWELNNAAEKLRTDLAATFPGDRRYAVIGGDCNTRLDTGLEFVRPLRWAPAFAFIDPRGLDVGWETLERLSRWRQDRKAGRKVELWILMAEPALERVLGLRGVQGQSSADRLSWLFGSDDWVAIHQHRRRELFSPQQTRAEFVNLYRWRLQKVLGYKRTHPLQFGNVSNHPVYTMIFATDDVTGDKIMADVYDRATMSEIPAMRSQAFEARRLRREDEKGVARLFDPDPASASGDRYEYIEPWEPPARLDDHVDLAEEPGSRSEE